ncbi:putative drug exporter of the RND superfamily [Staphylococcus auricularis]|uniref:MMPL family transporter n=1 Tax=Staphylococcus auricularis TaxID=29379 RepID=UPI0019349D12|nr:MMPL family transporter [Staphylococcus auricularis]MBM0868407.1 MMPL family transporter [Staphylococcus auricularis]MCG7342176.1 MMPL family transporter [Staphylococcus auricularis]
MAKLLYKLGRFIAKDKWLSVIVWLVVLGVIITPLILHTPKFDNDLTMNGLKSLDTNEKISKEFHQDSEKATMRLVFHSDKEKGITDKDTKKDIEEALDQIRQNDDYVQNISNPYETGQVNDEENTAIADIHYVVSQTAMQDSSKKIINNELDDVKADHNIQIEQTDQAGVSSDIGGNSELVGIIVAFVILLITFGSLIAAGMPIISALIGLGSSVGIISLLTFVADIPNTTLTLAVMIGLAVGIDYSLFILFRYKEFAKKGTEPMEAIGLAVGTAGSAVIFAGVTVMMAVCGLSLVGIDFLTTMGFASALSVLFAVLAALTLLPALISIFHKRIKLKGKAKDPATDKGNPWANFIVGKPWIATILSLIILIVALLPMSHMRLGMPDDSIQPENSSQHKAYELVSDNFGEGYNGQIVMLVNTKDGGSEDQIKRDLNNMRDDISDIDHVDSVTEAQLNGDNHYALMAIIPEEGPNAESTSELTKDLRDFASQAKEKYDFSTEISGQSVINIDMSQKLNNAIPVFAGVIVGLAFILLMFVFRSLLVSLKAVLGFVLTLGATLGFTTLVMQDGFMAGLFGIDQTAPVLAFLPVVTIGLLFGLAIDYELFLMTRVHEEYGKTGDNDHAIRVGIQESGPVIVAAALIMFSVFFAFVFQEDQTIKSIGVSLSFGVLFDAFIVRMTLIPALTKLFGHASWYLPKWLQRVLPKIDVEGKALEPVYATEGDADITAQERTSISDHSESQVEAESHATDQTHEVRQASTDHPENIDYEAAYTQSTNHVPQASMEQTHRSRGASEVDQQAQSSKLYQALAAETEDDDILFNALMLYARQHQPEIYEQYVRKLQTLRNELFDELNRKS